MLLARRLFHHPVLTKGSPCCLLWPFHSVRVLGPDAISSKVELARTLGIERPLKKNKERGDAALKSCLEILAEYLAAKATAASTDVSNSGTM